MRFNQGFGKFFYHNSESFEKACFKRISCLWYACNFGIYINK